MKTEYKDSNYRYKICDVFCHTYRRHEVNRIMRSQQITSKILLSLTYIYQGTPEATNQDI